MHRCENSGNSYSCNQQVKHVCGLKKARVSASFLDALCSLMPVLKYTATGCFQNKISVVVWSKSRKIGALHYAGLHWNVLNKLTNARLSVGSVAVNPFQSHIDYSEKGTGNVCDTMNEYGFTCRLAVCKYEWKERSPNVCFACLPAWKSARCMLSFVWKLLRKVRNIYESFPHIDFNWTSFQLLFLFLYEEIFPTGRTSIRLM